MAGEEEDHLVSLEVGECHQEEDFKVEDRLDEASKEEEAIKDEEDGVDVVDFNVVCLYTHIICMQYAH